MHFSLFLKLALVILAVGSTKESLPDSIMNLSKTISNVLTYVKGVADSILSPKSTTLNGDCKFNNASFSCVIQANSDLGITATGKIPSSVPSFFKKGNVLQIPYLYITDINTDKDYFPPSVTYSIKIKRFGDSFTFSLEDDWSINVNDDFLSILRSNHKYYKNLASNTNTILAGKYEQLKVELKAINESKDNYTADKEKIVQLNAEIKSTGASLDAKALEKNNLVIVNTGLVPSIENKRIGSVDAKRNFDICNTQAVSINSLLDTYSQYAKEFTDDKKYDFLDKEQTNLCKFHFAAVDLSIMLPNQTTAINEVKSEVTKEHNLEGTDKLFTSSEFFINDK